MLRHLLALTPDVDEDAGVDADHDGEGEKVEDAPEHQVVAAVHRGHGGTAGQVAQAVPAHGGHQTHDYGQQPDEDDDDEDAAGAHLAVQLHVEDGLVAFHGHSQEVEDGGGQTGVYQTLADEPLVLGEFDGPGTSVKHQVEVGDTCGSAADGGIGLSANNDPGDSEQQVGRPMTRTTQNHRGLKANFYRTVPVCSEHFPRHQ